MAEKYTQLPVEYDETHEYWIVKLNERELDCESKTEADVISNYRCLYNELKNTSKPYDQHLIQRLQQTVEIIKIHRISGYISNKLKSILRENTAEKKW